MRFCIYSLLSRPTSHRNSWWEEEKNAAFSYYIVNILLEPKQWKIMRKRWIKIQSDNNEPAAYIQKRFVQIDKANNESVGSVGLLLFDAGCVWNVQRYATKTSLFNAFDTLWMNQQTKQIIKRLHLCSRAMKLLKSHFASSFLTFPAGLLLYADVRLLVYHFYESCVCVCVYVWIDAAMHILLLQFTILL